MSGSNAIHGIVLVGAMIIMGDAPRAPPQMALGVLRRPAGHPQHRRRLRGDRPDARDVQGQAGESRAGPRFRRQGRCRVNVADALARPERDPRRRGSTWSTCWRPSAFILALKGLSSPKHARNGNLLAAAAAAWPSASRSSIRSRSSVPHHQPGPRARGHGHRRGRRRAGGAQGEDDGDAADGGHLQRRGRRSRRPDLDRGVPRRRALRTLGRRSPPSTPSPRGCSACSSVACRSAAAPSPSPSSRS